MVISNTEHLATIGVWQRRFMLPAALAAGSGLLMACAPMPASRPASTSINTTPALTSVAPRPIAAAPAPAPRPVLVRPGRIEADTRADLFNFMDPGLFASRLAINKSCLAAAQSSTQSFTYVAGDCNSQALPDGFAAARVFRTVVEGLFANGMPVPGTPFRVYESWPNDNVNRNRLASSGAAYECTDMSVELGNREVRALSTSSTVCRQGSITSTRRSTRLLRSKAEKSILVTSGRGPMVQTPTPGSSRSIFQNALLETEGEFIFDPYKSEWWGDYSARSYQAVVFAGSTYRYHIRGNLVCVEGSAVCAPKLYEGGSRDAPVLGTTFQASDGTLFRPASNDLRPYDIWHGKAPPNMQGLLVFGDAVWLRPNNGTITYPSGKSYTGKFVNGLPLF